MASNIMNAKDHEISVLEQHAMLAALRLHPNGYGVSIRDEITKRTQRAYSLGSIYAALERLTNKGFVEVREGEATAERGGRKKTYFTLSASGSSALQQSLVAIDAMRHGLKLQEA